MRLEYSHNGVIIYRRHDATAIPPVGTFIRMPTGTLFVIEQLLIDYEANGNDDVVAVLSPHHVKS